MKKITVEELDILVQTNVKEAMKDFSKLVPEIKKQIKLIQEEFASTDLDFSKLDIKPIETGVKQVRKSLKETFDPNVLDPQLLKRIDEIANGAEKASEEIAKVGTARKNENTGTYVKYNSDDIQAFIDNYNGKVKQVKPQIQQTAQEITQELNNSLNNTDTDTLKSKIQNVVDTIKSKLTNGDDDPFDLGETENQIRLLDIQISQLESKIEQVKDGKINLSDEDIAKTEVKLDELYNKKEKLEQGESEGGFFAKLSSKISIATGKIKQATIATASWKNGFNQINKVSLGITNKINQMGTKMKLGLKQVLKYAMALFSLRSIYTTLSSSANAWLSSQNAQAQQLSANIDYMKYAMGSVFAPVIEYVINLVYKLMKAIQSLVYAFSGINIFAKATASSMSSTASSAKDTNKSLAGVHDEINNVSESSGSGSGSTSPSFDLSSVDTASNFMDAIANGDWYLAGQLLSQKINGVLESINWTSIQGKAINIATNIGNFINGAVDGLDWSLLGTTIGNGINTALMFVDKLLTTINFTNIGIGMATKLNATISSIDWNLLGKTLADILNMVIDFAFGWVTTFDFSTFGTSIATSINSFFSNIEWGTAGQTLTEGIKGMFDGVTGFFQELDWSTLLDGLFEFINNIDWAGIAESMFTALGTAVASFMNLGMLIGNHIAKAFTNIGQYFQEEIDACGGNIVEGIFNGISNALVNIGTWIYEHIFKPFIDGFKSTFGINSPSTVMAEQGEYIIQGLLNGISSLIDKVVEIWTNLKTTIVEKATEIKTKVVEKITELKTNVVNKIAELKTSAVSKVTELKTKAVSIFENLKSSITTKITNIKTTIVNGFTNAVNYIKSLPSQALTWGKDIIGNIVNGITSKISDVKNAVSKVANTIKSYLGFSEPDVGPLSDFHTYMPDMIKLMSEGIKDNVDSLMNEVESLSADMSYTLNVATMPDYSLAGADVGNISSNTLRTASNIAENNAVTFSPRIVAQIGDDVIIDKVIDGINKKSERVGKSVIKVDY